MIFSLSGCGPGNRIVAVINGQVVTEQDVNQRMAKLNPSYRAALGNDRRRLIEEMVMETVLVQEARRRGLDRDREVQRLLKEASRQILLGRLLEVIRQSNEPKVDDQAIVKVYESQKESFREPETFRASHILVDNEQAAKQALERVKGGEPFAKVAQEVSIDTTKSRGGDIGPFTKGQLIPEFEAACERLKPGDLGDVVKSALGFHVILLTERRAARIRPLEEVKDQIQRQLVVQQQQQQVEAFVQDLRAKAHVQIRETVASSVSTSPSVSTVPPSEP